MVWIGGLNIFGCNQYIALSAVFIAIVEQEKDLYFYFSILP